MNPTTMRTSPANRTTVPARPRPPMPTDWTRRQFPSVRGAVDNAASVMGSPIGDRQGVMVKRRRPAGWPDLWRGRLRGPLKCGAHSMSSSRCQTGRRAPPPLPAAIVDRASSTSSRRMARRGPPRVLRRPRLDRTRQPPGRARHRRGACRLGGTTQCSPERACAPCQSSPSRSTSPSSSQQNWRARPRDSQLDWVGQVHRTYVGLSYARTQSAPKPPRWGWPTKWVPTWLVLSRSASTY
jgi:hypothetical protein